LDDKSTDKLKATIYFIFWCRCVLCDSWWTCVH